MSRPPPVAGTGGYASQPMHERRRRILREARKLLVARGLEGFSYRELGRAAKVAERTIYNAFGGREQVIAMAIRRYYDQFVATIRHNYPNDTLDGILEQLFCTHVRNGDIKNYTKAVVALYYSPTADPAIREALRRIGVDGLSPWVLAMKRAGELRPGVDFDDLVDNLSNVQYMILAGWCLGEVDNERFVYRMIEAFLLMASGATQRRAHAEIIARLKDMHGRRLWFDASIAGARQALLDVGIRPPVEPERSARGGG